ncbi:MAG: GTP-binding protein [Nocardioidaceae bacterium]
MSTLNLGIVAHVDAGKTTLTERLLFETGVTTHLGRVDHGDTTTDADDLERQRGITIRSAVVSFTIRPTDGAHVKVNLIDTPGHSDFVAEVERALAVLDGAVLGRYLPTSPASADEPLQASVFKIERGTAGHKVAFARLHAGTLTARDHVVVHHRSPTGTVSEHKGRVTGVSTFKHGAETVTEPAQAGDIAKIVGLADIEIGDQLGLWDPARGGRHFPPPGLEAVVQARNPADRPALFAALRRLCEQDPLIDARLDGVDQELTVSLYGEVQKEVLAARLAAGFHVDAEFLPMQTVYVERVTGVGHAIKVIGTPDNFDLATVGLRVEPGPVDSGITYRREVELGGLLLSFHTAIEETVPATLENGLCGWRVTDCIVTLTHSGYSAPLSAAGDFRRLTAIVLREALRRAGTTICAPVSEFELEVPAVALSQVLHKLHAAWVTPQPPAMGTTRCRITGVISTDQVDGFEKQLPGLSHGEGVMICYPAGYRAVHGQPPVRASSRAART